MPSYENTPMSSAVMFQTNQYLAMKDKQDSHSISGDVSGKYRRKNLSNLSVDQEQVGKRQEQASMERIHLMD